MVRLTQEHLDRIFAQAGAEFPNECCGILAGTAAADTTCVREVHPVENVWDGDRGHRFLVDPRAQMRVQREARDRGLEIVGFYHSHPTGSAQPSRFDAELAWPQVAYLIVSLHDGQPGEARAWRYDESAGAFVEEPVQVAR